MWIEELTSGKYKYNERYTDPYTEKQKKVSVTLNSKSAQAKKQATTILQGKIELKLKNPTIKRRTWSEVYEEWWEIYKHTVKSNTIRSRIRDKKRLDNDISADIVISNIDSNFISDILNKYYYNDNLSKSYIEQLTAHLNLVMRYAKTRKYIQSNPMLDVKIKEKVKTIEQLNKEKSKYLETEELKEVLKCVRAKNERYANLFEFMALMGTRIGETLALKFENVESGSIEIASTYNHDLKIHETPKNAYSYRKIEMPDRVLEIIEDQKRLNDVFCNTKRNFKNQGYIFFSTHGNPLHLSDINFFLRNYVAKDVELKTRQLSTHIFRHTHVSILAELGMPLKAIMDRVGHNNSNTTLSIYTHVTDKMKSDLIGKLNSLDIAP